MSASPDTDLDSATDGELKRGCVITSLLWSGWGRWADAVGGLHVSVVLLLLTGVSTLDVDAAAVRKSVAGCVRL